MPLLAKDPQDRAEQLLLVTERLIALTEAEAKRVAARASPADPATAEEHARLVLLYRQEVSRIRADPALVGGLSPTLKARLTSATQTLEAAVAAHQRALEGLKALSEGLVRTLAEEIARLRSAEQPYGADGGSGASATLAAQGLALDRRA